MSNPGTVEHLGKNYIFSECMQFSREVSWNKWAEVYEICCGLKPGPEELRPYTLLSLAEPGPGPVTGEWSTTELRALAALTVSLSESRALAALTVSLSESLPALAALVSLPTSGIVTPASSSSAVSASGPAKQALVRAAAARVGVALLLAAVGDRSPPSSEWRAAGGAGPRQSAGCCRTMAE